ncbi:hypothetical protein FSP39_008821 [Pinctada imbricata]|uniref:26S proteasome non-ATPase regulatory subunit 10 n=1 Tax=Pinctada imbricata TaxID=66713 RepID=A0AA88XQN2_PINIB|nr:hypothetical protein FSP39_008821 [Pinctada imbricata]
MALSDPKDVNRLAYDGKLEELKIKLRENNDLLTNIDDTQRMPLHWACSAGRKEIVEYLLKSRAPVDARDEIAEKLLQSGADLNIADQYGHTPMHRAASKGLVKMMKLFLQYIVDVNSKDVQGNTPLHLACEEERSEAALLLLEHGGQLELLNKEEKTPLDLAPPGLRRSLDRHNNR